jgi:hypothetical protein
MAMTEGVSAHGPDRPLRGRAPSIAARPRLLLPGAAPFIDRLARDRHLPGKNVIPSQTFSQPSADEGQRYDNR